jgi:hypothetical protein
MNANVKEYERIATARQGVGGVGLDCVSARPDL